VVTTWILAVLVVFSVGLVLMMLAAQCRQLRRPRPGTDHCLPAVSILKPLKGVDHSLAANLEAFFVLDYPRYEIVFGVADADDPALDVAREVARRHPEVPVRFAVGGPEVGCNPKVNNLANILRRCRHQVLLISDSNVAVEPDMLRVMAAELARDDVGLVTSLIRGVGGSGIGGALESLQLNTFVMGGVAAVSGVLGRVCAVGKSMLLSRDDLDAIGGLAELARYLAEDQVCGELMCERGRRAVVCPHPVDNVLGRLTIREFIGRHLRWARIRRKISPAGYAGEALTNPLLPALGLVAAAPGLASYGIASAVLALLCAAAIAAERQLGVRRPLIHYPPIVALRCLLAAILWPVPFVSNTVSWRGRRYRIGRRTLLLPSRSAWEPDELADFEPDEVVA
jgi:ceramide glucosyltransferase